MKKLLAFTILVLSSTALADIMQDFDSLGGNEGLYEKVNSLSAEKKVEVVQNRIVDRSIRHEFSLDGSMVIGGNPYLSSRSLGFNYNFHITPRWTVGLKYSTYANELSSEGKNLISQIGYIPRTDWPKASYQLVGAWYPMYGKFSVLDQGVVHFDFYGLLGAGQIETFRGETELYSAGVGVGLWISQHITSRIEFKYETFEANEVNTRRQMDTTVATLMLGYLL